MAATPENGFQPFVTIGPYFPMGGGGSSSAYCPSTEASTSELLADISVYGGSVSAVSFGSNTGWSGNLEDAMRAWWLFKGVSVILSANGTYTDYTVTPNEQKNWVLSQSQDNPVQLPGVVRPNKYGGTGGSERILNCIYQQGFSFEDQISQTIDEVSYDNNFRVHLFKTDESPESAASPDNAFIEFFSYIEPFSPDIQSTNYGLFIISTRDRDYTDVITEGSDNFVITQQIGARKTLPITSSVANVPLTFYASLFIMNSNTIGWTVEDFDVEFLAGSLWERV